MLLSGTCRRFFIKCRWYNT